MLLQGLLEKVTFEQSPEAGEDVGALDSRSRVCEAEVRPRAKAKACSAAGLDSGAEEHGYCGRTEGRTGIGGGRSCRTTQATVRRPAFLLREKASRCRVLSKGVT